MYNFVAVITTCLVVTALYYHYRPELHPSKLRRIIAETSIIFTDATFWLALMAMIAGYMCIAGKAKSDYELAMAYLVTSAFQNAGLLSLAIFISYRKDLPDFHSLVIRYVALLITLMVGLFISKIHQVQLEHLRSEFVDIPCYANGSSPSNYYYKPPSYTIFAFLCVIMTGVSFSFSSLMHTESSEKKFQFGLFICFLLVTSILLIGLWCDFYAILKLKARARAAFGPSYQDDAFGYGQIMAIGFAAQALFTLIYRFTGTYTPLHFFAFRRASIDFDAIAHILKTYHKKLSRQPQADEELQRLANRRGSIEISSSESM